MREERH